MGEGALDVPGAVSRHQGNGAGSETWKGTSYQAVIIAGPNWQVRQA